MPTPPFISKQYTIFELKCKGSFLVIALRVTWTLQFPRCSRVKYAYICIKIFYYISWNRVQIDMDAYFMTTHLVILDWHPHMVISFFFFFSLSLPFFVKNNVWYVYMNLYNWNKPRKYLLLHSTCPRPKYWENCLFVSSTCPVSGFISVSMHLMLWL